MRFGKIPDNEDGYYLAFKMTDVEGLDPIAYFKEFNILTNTNVLAELAYLYAKENGITIAESAIQLEAIKQATQMWKERYQSIRSIPIPNEIKNLIVAKSKSNQQQALRSLELSPKKLESIMYWMYDSEGYSFSQYISTIYPEDIDDSELPDFIHLYNKKIITSGETSLTERQLRHSVEFKKSIISKFFDKDEHWHCFFISTNSIKGKESWNSGQPHFHYISDKFGHPREYVVKQLKSKNYKLGNLPHINLVN